MRTFRKDPAEVVTWGIDWRDKIRGDTISNSYWIVDEGIGVSGSYVPLGVSYATFSGGDLDTQYRAENRIVTQSGEVYERSFMVQVVDR